MLISVILLIIILIIALLILLQYNEISKKDQIEAFNGIPVAGHNEYVADSQDKFNSLTNLINLTAPIISPSTKSISDFNNATSVISAKPTANAFDLRTKNPYKIPSNLPSTYQNASVCENAKADCSAFDDPVFAANCGMSFDSNGLSNSGQTHIGGLYISTEDRQKQLKDADAVLSSQAPPYDPYMVYQPTLGKAKPGTFALTKEHCRVIQERVECEKKQTFNSPNCTQCYTSQTFSRIDPNVPRIGSTLNLVGKGNVTIIPMDGNDSIKPINKALLDPVNPIQVSIGPDGEGKTFQVAVEGDPATAFIAGYIEGGTARGVFKLDFNNMVVVDSISNSKAKLGGSMMVNGFNCLVLMIATGKQSMALTCLMPFSFLSLHNTDTMSCDNGPIITQSASATFLESDPCYGGGSTPGNYKLECLQQKFLQLGGTANGEGYPSTIEKATLLQKGARGEGLDIDTIAENIYRKVLMAATGKGADGNMLSLSDWNDVSVWATGRQMNTPCDGPNNKTGPLAQECLSYLYTNSGVGTHIGATYTLSSDNSTLKGSTGSNVFCQPGTVLDPNTPTGLKFGQSLGGMDTVKQTYDKIHRTANDNSLKNNERRDAIMKCYGVTIDDVSGDNN